MCLNSSRVCMRSKDEESIWGHLLCAKKAHKTKDYTLCLLWHGNVTGRGIGTVIKEDLWRMGHLNCYMSVERNSAEHIFGTFCWRKCTLQKSLRQDGNQCSQEVMMSSEWNQIPRRKTDTKSIWATLNVRKFGIYANYTWASNQDQGYSWFHFHSLLVPLVHPWRNPVDTFPIIHTESPTFYFSICMSTFSPEFHVWRIWDLLKVWRWSSNVTIWNPPVDAHQLRINDKDRLYKPLPCCFHSLNTSVSLSICKLPSSSPLESPGLSPALEPWGQLLSQVICIELALTSTHISILVSRDLFTVLHLIYIVSLHHMTVEILCPCHD